MAFQLNPNILLQSRSVDITQPINTYMAGTQIKDAHRLKTRKEKARNRAAGLYRSTGGDLRRTGAGLIGEGFITEGKDFLDMANRETLLQQQQFQRGTNYAAKLEYEKALQKLREGKQPDVYQRALMEQMGWRQELGEDRQKLGWAKYDQAGRRIDIKEREVGLKEQPGVPQLDKIYAKDYAEFVSKGGFADAAKGIKQTQNVKKALESGKNLTGAFISILPDAVRARTSPESIDVQEQLEEVVQRNLRIILGAQFTEKEGVRLIARAYNPALDEKINAKRVGRLLTQMEDAIKAKVEALRWFEENETMRGFRSSTLNKSMRNLGINVGTVKKSITKTNSIKSPSTKTSVIKNGMTDEELDAEIKRLEQELK